jgi:hypothetical protein
MSDRDERSTIQQRDAGVVIDLQPTGAAPVPVIPGGGGEEERRDGGELE